MMTLAKPRITTLYNHNPKTFRLGSRALFKNRTIFKGFGTNLQNVPKGLRNIILADPGKILLQVDQAGAEALIVAYLVRGDGKFRQLFTSKIKPHSFVALHVFARIWQEKLAIADGEYAEIQSLDPKELRSHPRYDTLFELIKSSDGWPAKERYYFIAKMLCHALNYGLKGPTFALHVLQKSDGALNLTTRQATEYCEFYHGLFPEIREWHGHIVENLRGSMILRNLFGYPRLFTGLWGDELFKEAYAFIPQSTVGCITHKAITGLQNIIEADNLDWDILQNGHDSMLVQAPENDWKSCAKAMQNLIEADLVSPDGTKFKMRSELQIGHNWGPKSDYNPEGMEEIKL